MQYNDKEKEGLPDQRGRILRSRRGSVTVPGTPSSSSNDGLTSGCTAGPLAENAPAKMDMAATIAAQAQIVLTRCEEERRREAAGLPLPLTLVSSEKEGRTRSRSRSRSSSGSSYYVPMPSKRKGVPPKNFPRESDSDTDVIMGSDCSVSTTDGDKMSTTKRRRDRTPSDEGKVEDTRSPDKKKEKRGQGRPRTTGLYVGRAKAQEEVNQKLREEADLLAERDIRAMSMEQLYKSGRRSWNQDVDAQIEKLSETPTADVSNRARESLTSVLKVSRISKNLKGTCSKELRMAALVGTAALEVLRTRADGTSDEDIFRQMRSMRRELDEMKRDLEASRRETESLRLELREERAKRSKLEETRAEIAAVDDAARSPVLAATQVEDTVVSMEMDQVVEEPAAVSTEPEYSDERRKAEILPPMDEWPPAVRPAIGGKVKILEDIQLKPHTIVLKNALGKGEKKNKPPPSSSSSREKRELPSEKAVNNAEERGLAQTLLPMLEKWLGESLKAYGLTPVTQKATGARKSRSRSAREGTANAAAGTAVARRSEDTAGKAKAITAAGRPTDNNTWAQVVGRAAKKKSRAQNAPAQAKQVSGRSTIRRSGPPLQSRTQGNGNGKAPAANPAGNSNKKARRRRPPRLAAVALTCPPEKYSEALRIVKESIDLKTLGIQALKPKRAMSGGLILEITGPNGAEKAIALRDKMEAALSNMEGTRVTRPQKMADLRIKDILDVSDVREVVKVVAETGGCRPEDIRAGEVRAAPNGLGTVWVQCPLAAANKVATAGKMKIGWTMARVELLPPRQLHCFRCLERGHTQVTCTNAIDRRDVCYRCGKPGHVAKHCTEKPQCLLCMEAGRPATHRLGGPACKAPVKRRGMNNRGIPAAAPAPASPPGNASTSRVEQMEIEEDTTQSPVTAASSSAMDRMDREQPKLDSARSGEAPLERRTGRKKRQNSPPQIEK